MKRIFFIFCLLIFITGCQVEEPPELHPISVQGTEFMQDDEPFHFIGAFTFPTLTHIIYEDRRMDWQSEMDEYLDSLQSTDIEVIRFLAFGRYQMKISGKEEPNWERIDYLIDQCEKRGIYIIYVLWDYWDYGEGAKGTKQKVYGYWMDPKIKPIIENTVNRYKDKKAIFAWELINEGDADGFIVKNYVEVYRWVEEISSFVKSLDDKHLLSTGFSGEILREAFVDDPATFGRVTENLIELYSLPELDFLTFHSYGGDIDSMREESLYGEEWKEMMRWYVEETLRMQTHLQKPILFEEWGVQRQVGPTKRTEVYQFMLGLFAEKGISNMFNGWGNEKEEQSMLIYLDDSAEVEMIR